MVYDFDKVIERRGTNSIKYDRAHCDDSLMIPMWVADMDFETLPEIQEALIKRAEHGIFGYATLTDEYIDAVVSWMKDRHQFNVSKDWIIATPGIVTALKIAVRAYTQEGDSVMIHKPVYHPFDKSVISNNRKVVECPLSYKDKEYSCDFELFEKTIQENDVKLFILCNPHNPVGKVWTKEELKTMGDICQKHNVIVVSDEIHMDFVYEGYTHTAFYEVDPSFKDFSIICSAPSKTFNLAALQTSNIIVADEGLRERFVEEKAKSGIENPNIFGLEACQAAYTYGHEWVDELVKYLEGNIQYIDAFLKNHLPNITLTKPESLYLLWLDMRSLNKDSDELEKFLLEDAHLWLNNGAIFGTGGEGFMRMNIACPRSTIEKAMLQLEKAINNM